MKWHIVVQPLVAALVRAVVPALVGGLLALLADAGLLDHAGRQAALDLLNQSGLSLSSPALAR